MTTLDVRDRLAAKATEVLACLAIEAAAASPGWDTFHVPDYVRFADEALLDLLVLTGKITDAEFPFSHVDARSLHEQRVHVYVSRGHGPLFWLVIDPATGIVQRA